MVKCIDCLSLKFTSPHPEYTMEWWGYECDDDDSPISKRHAITDEEMTWTMIIANRKCSCFKQLACFKCGKLLKHEFEKETYDADLCNACADKVYNDMARAEGLL